MIRGQTRQCVHHAAVQGFLFFQPPVFEDVAICQGKSGQKIALIELGGLLHMRHTGVAGLKAAMRVGLAGIEQGRAGLDIQPSSAVGMELHILA